MALLPNIGVQAFICSVKNKIEHFLSGFSGYGWKIWEWTTGRWKLEVDDLMVRKTMTVFELIINKIRSVVGALAITQAHGKIKSIDSISDPDNYLITLEDTNSFMEDDFIRMQEFSGTGKRSYWVKVSEIRGEIVVIPKSEFEEEQSAPEVGDEIVQFGNQRNTARQSAIYLHTDESGQPAIDIMFDIDSKSFDGKIKMRMGTGLPGVSDEFKGLYAENGMLKFTDAEGNVTSAIWPDGRAELGAGSVLINPDKSGYIGGEDGLRWEWNEQKNKFVCTFGKDAILQWGNLSEEAKENLKGEDANLLPWIEDWEKNKTKIGSDYFISPKIFSGARNENSVTNGVILGGDDGKRAVTGVALGKDVIEINGVKHSGVFGIKDGNLIFSLDADSGDAQFTGKFESNQNGNRIIIDPNDRSIKMISEDGNESGKLSFHDSGSMLNLGQIGGKGRTSISAFGLDDSDDDGNFLTISRHGMLLSNTLGSFLVDVGEKNSGDYGNYFRVRIDNLPTSPSGLSSGSLWRDGNNLKIVI
ncbi:hypothetical protein [Bacteroides sp. 519]|uniref:hypothetical protein n=1 Tax=Bacteroides sp. 519 TaxID=2302937 RepID=UPI0013D2CD0B|nr:hypothetical protein [Bacteroides sp. 519]NDV58059.1 hypothetical protein [Bacteroides sp. 519]